MESFPRDAAVSFQLANRHHLSINFSLIESVFWMRGLFKLIMKFLGLIVFLFSALVDCEAQSNDQELVRQCAAQQSCSSCIKTPSCVWCPATGTNGTLEIPVRCIPRGVYEQKVIDGSNWCSGSTVINEVSSISFEKNINLSSIKGREPVQVQPQKIKLRLRKGEEFWINLTYTQAEDYPVDLYYLMDLSASMHEYREHLSELGADLATIMRNLTSKFRLGFGSFVDKVVLPMTDTSPSKLEKPCTFQEGRNTVDCAPPYSFKHQLSLIDDDKVFRRKVKAAPISGNLDAPEGGFDALMQALVCTGQIGWSDNARHLLVFSTDATSHMAGDGRLAGVIEPNDCQCHLDEAGSYTHSLLQDYPSISQINKKARDHNVHVIFAVPKSKNTTYQMLSQSISGSAVGLIEKDDTTNVINLIRDEYEKIVSSVQLIDTAPDFINLRYFSRCLNKTGDLKERKSCDELHFGDVVDFRIAVTATLCPTNEESRSRTFRIRPQGLKDNLEIEVELICDCPCDRQGNSGYIENAKECNSHGSLICGVCSCDSGYYGEYCDCRGNDDADNTNRRVDDCRASANDTSDCSGHGTCKCGKCECRIRPTPEEKYYGKYCECNNFSCKRVADGNRHLLCGDHGDCVCGTCKCRPGWSGESCDCRDNSTCFPPGKNTEICSGHGDCVCGRCKCNPSNIYSGDYCQNSYCSTPQSCAGSDCDNLRDCVECLVYDSGPKAASHCDGCDNQINLVDKVELEMSEHEAGVRMCWVPSEDGCTFSFKYQILSDRGDITLYNITAQTTKKCSDPVPVLGVAIGVIASTVILGFLVLLIWKIVTMMHDRREYARFEKERALAKWERGDNPLYKQATTTFCNPTFTESKKDST